MQKFERVISVIERRIRSGDYLLHPIPGERRIAEETGVSHMTARKAVRGLLDRKILIRDINGALSIYPGYHADFGGPQVMLLCPAYPSPFLLQLCLTVAAAAKQHGFNIRPVQYVHWDDPVVVSAVSKPGGTIIIPSSFDVPEHVLAALRANKGISLALDLSDKAVPSIRLFRDSDIKTVFTHLQKLGHTCIDCISTHVHNQEIERRIRLWRDWSHRHDMAGELRENAAPSFSDPTPFAYKMMRRLLKHEQPKATAFVCTTFPAAIGAVRACWEQGLVVGKDVSICAVNIEAPARFMTPSVTGLDTPDISGLLGQCLDWFTADRPWTGSRCLEPAKANFFKGESTAPIPIEGLRNPPTRVS